MIDDFLIDDLLIELRTLYKDETDPLLKELWLKFGLEVKRQIDNGECSPIDFANDEYMNRLFSNVD